jgi:hypothetical protein
VEPNALKKNGIKAALLKDNLNISRTTAHRMVTGEWFRTLRPLFKRLYEVTNLTPNDILGIPPKNGGK